MSTPHQFETSEAYFRSQAAVVAAALRDGDATTSSSSVQETFRQLCFDDPIVSAPACHALAQALLVAGPGTTARETQHQHHRRLALTNRFVEGVSQLVRRRRQQQQQPPSQDSEPQQEAQPLVAPRHEPTNDDDATTTTTGYTWLAWTIHGQIPLLLLLSDHLAEAAVWMGHFRGYSDDNNDANDAATTAANRMMQPESTTRLWSKQQEAEAWEKHHQQQQQLQEDETLDSTLQMATTTNDNEYEEVWAAESDPSDYDYGTEPTPQQRLDELDAWNAPMHLGIDYDDDDNDDDDVPIPTWNEVAAAVTQLLQGLTYSSCLVDLVTTPKLWKTQGQISEKLTQCTLTLLLPFGMKEAPLFQEMPDSHWQQLALYPLHAFRDAVEQNVDQMWLLDDYLQLLVLLLQANHHASTTGSSFQSTVTTPTSTTTPATLVGLGAMAALCQSCLESNHRLRLRAVRDAILRVTDDLTALLEQATPTTTTPGNTNNNDNLNNESTTVIPWTFLSLWQVLCHNAAPLTAAQAQTLLQSGIFRQWMLLWQTLGTKQHHQQAAIRTAMQGAIWNLCCVSPNLLGKYAWRFADFAAHVTTPNEAMAADDDVFLWNLLGIHLASNNSSGTSSGLVSLKKSQGATVRPAPTAAVCQNQAQTTWDAMCTSIAHTLQEWKDRREGDETASTDDDTLSEETKQLFASFHAVVEALSIPLVQQLFCQQLVSDNFSVSDSILPIRKILVAWPSPKSVHEDTKENAVDDEKEGDEAQVTTVKEDKPSNETEVPKHKRGRVEVEDEVVTAMRRSIKVLQSILEAGNENSSGRFSSKAD